jgi:DNA modification methylase
MSRFILGNCIDIMGGFPDRAVDFILTDPRTWSASVTAGPHPCRGQNRRVAPACLQSDVPRTQKRRADGQFLRLEPRRSFYGRMEKRRVQRGRASGVHQNLLVQIRLCRLPP